MQPKSLDMCFNELFIVAISVIFDLVNYVKLNVQT